jgi:hypothetical protein
MLFIGPPRGNMWCIALIYGDGSTGSLPEGGMKMDMGVTEYLHTVHCANMLIMYADVDPSELGKLVTKTHVGFSSFKPAV